MFLCISCTYLHTCYTTPYHAHLFTRTCNACQNVHTLTHAPPLTLHTLQYSWKLLHPTNEYDNKECPKEAEAYERVRTLYVLVTSFLGSKVLPQNCLHGGLPGAV
jgi:hypothetical protein